MWLKVSNVFKAQPSFASDLAAMVPTVLGKIDTMHQRCSTMIHVSTHFLFLIYKLMVLVVTLLSVLSAGSEVAEIYFVPIEVSVCAFFLASCLCSKQSLQESEVDAAKEQLTEVSDLAYDKLNFLDPSRD